MREHRIDVTKNTKMKQSEKLACSNASRKFSAIEILTK